jgi:glycosyltransferase involved in cell wall biosynthesis
MRIPPRHPSDLRLLLVTEYFPPYRGGSERQVMLLARALSERVAACGVLTTRHGCRDTETDTQGLRVFRLPVLHVSPLRRLSHFAAAFLYVLLNGQRWNAVQGHCLSAFVLGAALAARLRRLPVAVKSCTVGRTGDIAKVRASLCGRVLWRYFVKEPVRFLAGSDVLLRDLEAHGVPPDRIAAVRHLVAFPGQAPDDRPAARRCVGLPDRTTVLYVGRFDESKGIGVLCSAWEASGIDSEAANLVFVGDGPLDQEVRAWAIHRPEVRVMSWSRPEPYYRAADILVFPSRGEGYGNVVAEAAGFGLAIVSTRVGVVPDLLKDGESALMVDPQDTAGIAAALRRLVASETLRRHLGHHARKAAASLSPETVLQAHIDTLASASHQAASWR